MRTTLNFLHNRKDLFNLIDDWEKNPDWELEDTPGFEEFYDELREYRLRREEDRDTARKQKKIRSAMSMGLTLPHYEIWKEHKVLATLHRDKAQQMLTNLIYDTENVDQEHLTIVNMLIDSIFRGSINAAKAEIIAEKYRFEEE